MAGRLLGPGKREAGKPYSVGHQTLAFHPLIRIALSSLP